MNRLVTVIAVIALQLVAATASHASSVAGRVMFASGPNSVERDGPTVGLIKGSFIFEGDTILTGERGRLQLLMVDGQRIAIRPNTVFSIQDYQLPANTHDPIAVASGDGKVTLRLVKGAFRAISGEIGKSYVKANYQVIAPVATMGIRGTDYNMRWCDGDCVGGDGPAPEDGLYIGVNVGGVWTQNADGEVDVDRNQYAYVAAANVAPVLLLAPPSVLNPSHGSQEEDEEEEDNRSEDRGESRNKENGGKDAADNNGDAVTDNGSGKEEPRGLQVAESRVPEQSALPAGDDEDEDTEKGSKPERPEQAIKARSAALGLELDLTDGSVQDDLEDIKGNPNDDRDGDPDDGNAGGGNDGGNPNDGNDGNPDDGNAGGGNDGGDSGGDSGGDTGGDSGGDTGAGFRDPYQPEDDDGDFDNIGNNRNDFRDGVLDGNAGGGNGVGSAYNAAVSLEDYGTATAPAEIFNSLDAEGSDIDTELKWGRWDSGFANAPAAAHYVTDSQVDRPVSLPTEGTMSYELSGGTAPTDSNGNTGVLNDGTLTADFVNMTVTNEINLTIDSDTWNAVGEGQIDTGAPVFDGTYDVTRDSGPTGTGQFKGFFGGAPLPSGAPSGAGVGYQLESGGVTVDGAAAFKAKP